MKRQRKNDRTINIYKILTIVLAVVLIVVLIIFGRSWMVQKNAQKEYEKLSAQVNDLQNQVNDNQINIPSDTQTETENVAQEVQTEDSELEQKGIEIPQKNLNWKKVLKLKEEDREMKVRIFPNPQRILSTMAKTDSHSIQEIHLKRISQFFFFSCCLEMHVVRGRSTALRSVIEYIELVQVFS